MRDFDPTASEFISSGYLERSRPGGVLYDIASIASIAGPIVGGLLQSDSADTAADAQTRAAAQSDATQRYFYDTNRADNAPFLNNGTAASNRLAYLLGIGGTGGSAPRENANQVRQRLLGQYTTTTPGTGRQLLRVIQGASDNGNEEVWGDATSPTTSVDEAGLNAAIQAEINRQNAADQQSQSAAQSDPNYGSLMRRFSTADLANDVPFQTGMKFGLEQGVQGINNQASATGSLLSGATLKALTRFGNDYGNQKAGDAYNRFNNDQTNAYNRLAGVAGAGQTASAQVGSAGMNAGNNISQSQIGVGNARGASAIAGSNAIGNGITGAFNNYQNNQLLKTLQGRNPSIPGVYDPNFYNGYPTSQSYSGV